MTFPVCPSCGQRLLMRHGIKLSPKKADLLDAIEDASKGRGGIEISVLVGMLYPGVSKQVALARLRVQISQLNSLLLSTNHRVVSPRRGLYRFHSEPLTEDEP